jgi:hypothetical protein
MSKLNTLILLILLTIAIYNTISITKLQDEVFWPEGMMKPLGNRG